MTQPDNADHEHLDRPSSTALKREVVLRHEPIDASPAIDDATILDQLPAQSVRVQTDRRSAIARALVLGRLRRITGGRLVVVEGQQISEVGSSDTALVGRIEVRDARFWGLIAKGGALGAGEAWINGWWTSPELTTVIRVLARDTVANAAKVDAGAGPIRRLGRWLGHQLRRNTRRGSRDNIHAHYDIGNQLFERMLDPMMMYSSAIYPTADASLNEAATHKLDVLCRELDLRPSDHLLEIGTGWGGLALHAARHYGCKVTTTTISAEQYRHAVALVHATGMDDRITVLASDYRDLTGTYDKLVSVEMIEAVGHQFYGDFFNHCSRLLSENGIAVLQAITIADQRFDAAKHRVDFIKRYVFPGSCIPSVTALCQAATASSDLRLLDQRDFTPHYAHTLLQWRENFREHHAEITKLGYDDRFDRMWEFYLAYCAGGFAERAISLIHQRWVKPGYRQDEAAWWPETRPA